jgi:hypothetical protein
VKTATIRGVRYKLILDEHIEGYIEVPEKRGAKVKREIYVDCELKGTKKHLRRLFHEVLHGLAPDSPHTWIEMASEQLATISWGAGYRLPEEEE